MYEYKVVNAERTDSLERTLNELAAEGWRVVAGGAAASGTGLLSALVIVLERRKAQ